MFTGAERVVVIRLGKFLTVSAIFQRRLDYKWL
jgi:hypothetical protein